jgi:hypothetical protein
MKGRDFDWLPVKDSGRIIGYVERADLKSGKCGRYRREFRSLDLLHHSAGLLDLMRRLHGLPRVFITDGGKVVGIATRGDLQNAPVRMLIFGVVTLLEMQMLRLIRENYPEDIWISSIPHERLEEAKQLQADRKERNEALDLADCLQFADKRQLILKSPQIRQLLGIVSRTRAEGFFKDAEDMRNRLAHGQDLLAGTSWPRIITMTDEMLDLLAKCEVL